MLLEGKSQCNQVLTATTHLFKMRGGAQSHLMLASDGNAYVTKFQNNPQDIRILANEMLATRIGRFLGLSMPDPEVIDVPESLIENSPRLCFDVAGVSRPCCSGKQFGARHVSSSHHGQVFDYLPESLMERVINSRDLIGALVFDKWTGNADGRQVIFARDSRFYQMTLIDQGYCFNAGQWNFLDFPLHGVFYRNFPYHGITGWDSFEPFLSRAERMTDGDLWNCADGIPEEWYSGDTHGLNQLIETLYQRRSRIRDLITAFRESSRAPFPLWKE